MSKWHSWESDYMKADMPYLVHLSKNVSDHKYFVGVFTGRFKDTLYFRDEFENEIALNVKEYLFDNACHIEFVPISEVNSWVYSESKQTAKQAVTYKDAVINSVKKSSYNSVICNATVKKDIEFEFGSKLSKDDKSTLLEKIMFAEPVDIELRYYGDSNILPTLVSILSDDKDVE